MAALDHEARIVQNSALGAGLIWRAAQSYNAAHRTKDYMPLPLGFVVLPIVYHGDTFDILKSTQRTTGLRGFAEKFRDSKTSQSDVLFAIHDRALRRRELSWNSITIAVQTRLISINCPSATVVPLSSSNVRGVPKLVRDYLKQADKLGEWFADLSLFEISSVLRVVF